MRFESIYIQNYRQYDHCQLDFNKVKDSDLHVVIASNGVGKTNLLNAIEWCLYDIEPHLGDQNSSLPICNMKALVAARSLGNKSEKALVKITASSGEDKIVFERSVVVQTNNYFTEKSKLKVFKTPSGRSTEILENDVATEEVNIMLPQRIKEYFFFDGEQLYNYFGKEDTNIHVKASIHEVAQISIVTSAKEHLDKIIKEYRAEIGKSNPQTNAISAEIDNKEMAKNELEDDIMTLEGQNRKAEFESEELDKKIGGAEGSVEARERHTRNLVELDLIEKRRGDENKKLVELIKKYYTPLMMYKINKSTHEYITEKKERGKLPPAVDIELIKNSLDNNICAICNRETTEDSEKHLREILDKLEVSIGASHLLMEINNDVKRACESIENYKYNKQAIFCSMKELDTRKQMIENENNEIKDKLLDSKITEKIAYWMDDREKLKALQKSNNQKIGANKARITQIEGDLVELNRKLEKALKESDKCEELNKRLAFAGEARKIVEGIESEIISEVKKKMEDETMLLFDSLIWKKDTYGRISLSDNYSLELFTKRTDQSCLGSCSAAERELLALAFTIALHKVSGHDAPLFIDTPVGRVSDTNRENFARNLITVSLNKQTILAFTPSEFSEEISTLFNDEVLSSKRRLGLVEEETVEVN